MKKIALVMGSDSDWKIAIEAANALREYRVPFETRVISAHRTPEKAKAFAESAISEGFGVLIAFAGKAAHLAGALAANTILPVIGVPVKSSTLDGMDALLSTVQMPSGVPVATVAIDGAKNAAILACQMLALSDEALANALRDAKRAAGEKADAADNKFRLNESYNGEDM